MDDNIKINGKDYKIADLTSQQKYLLEFKLTNIFNASIVFILRTLIFSLPAIFRAYIYKNFLRKKK